MKRGKHTPLGPGTQLAQGKPSKYRISEQTWAVSRITKTNKMVTGISALQMGGSRYKKCYSFEDKDSLVIRD